MNAGTANATIQTVSFCDLLLIVREDFDEVLREHLEVNPHLRGAAPLNALSSCGSRESFTESTMEQGSFSNDGSFNKPDGNGNGVARGASANTFCRHLTRRGSAKDLKKEMTKQTTAVPRRRGSAADCTQGRLTNRQKTRKLSVDIGAADNFYDVVQPRRPTLLEMVEAEGAIAGSPGEESVPNGKQPPLCEGADERAGAGPPAPANHLQSV